jgi:hypothetical protein
VSVFDENAAVHDDADAGLLGTGGCFQMDDAELYPEIFQAEGNHFVDDGRDKSRQAEDVDDVGLEGKRGERMEDGFAE